MFWYKYFNEHSAELLNLTCMLNISNNKSCVHDANLKV